MSEKETTSQASRRLREKNAAKAAKSETKQATPKGKKQPAPAKPKPQPTKKVAKKKSGTTKAAQSDASFMSASTLLQLKEDAVRIDKEISDAAQNVGTAMGGMAACHEKVEDFIDRELWRYLPTPYVSETQWVKDKNNLLGSAAKLFSIVGKFKALKGQTTQEQRVKMGARKGSVATSAAKKAAKKGKKLAPEIIEAATDPKVSEKELRKKVAEHPDTAPEPGTPKVDKRQAKMFDDEPDELLADTGKNTLPEKPGKGGSGVVEGTPGTALRFGGKLLSAVEQWTKLYYDPKAHGPMAPMERLKRVCDMFGKAGIDATQMHVTIREMLAEAARAEKEDFVMTNERAYEMLMHQP